MYVCLCVYLSSVHLGARIDRLLLWDGRQTFGSLPWQCDLVLATATSCHSSTLRMFNTKQCMRSGRHTPFVAKLHLSYNFIFILPVNISFRSEVTDRCNGVANLPRLTVAFYWQSHDAP